MKRGTIVATNPISKTAGSSTNLAFVKNDYLRALELSKDMGYTNFTDLCDNGSPVELDLLHKTLEEEGYYN